MSLIAIPDFDADTHTDAEIAKLQALADSCADATTADAITAAGDALDAARAKHRGEVRADAARNRSLNAVYKALVREVPRGTNIDGETIAVPERKVTT